MKSHKSIKRIKILTSLMDALKSLNVFGSIDYRRSSEDQIKKCLYMTLVPDIGDIYENLGCSKESAVKKAKKSLIMEGHTKQTLHNIELFGVWHRPDFEINMEGMSIAVELKKGTSGSSIREGIGQCITYNSHYDFVLYLFIDDTKDKKILNSLENEKEVNVIKELWDNHNTLFDMV